MTTWPLTAEAPSPAQDTGRKDHYDLAQCELTVISWLLVVIVPPSAAE